MALAQTAQNGNRGFRVLPQHHQQVDGNGYHQSLQNSQQKNGEYGSDDQEPVDFPAEIKPETGQGQSRCHGGNDDSRQNRNGNPFNVGQDGQNDDQGDDQGEYAGQARSGTIGFIGGRCRITCADRHSLENTRYEIGYSQCEKVPVRRNGVVVFHGETAYGAI